MSTYEKSKQVLKELFGHDCLFSMATARGQIPTVRVIDTYYEDGVFWIVTYAGTRKVKDIVLNPHTALVNEFHSFQGKAYNAGHPLKEENKAIRETLTQVFAPWYFAHNNEADEQMCFVRFEPETGFFHKDGIGYQVSFIEKTATEIPFVR